MTRMNISAARIALPVHIKIMPKLTTRLSMVRSLSSLSLNLLKLMIDGFQEGRVIHYTFVQPLSVLNEL
jgi:hypothetical protein